MVELLIGLVIVISFWKSIKKLGRVTDLALEEGLEVAEKELKTMDLEYSLHSQDRLRKIQEKIQDSKEILTPEQVKELLKSKQTKKK